MATQSSGKIPSSREERRRLNKSRRIFDEYLNRQDEGESVNPDEYLKKYPELEEDLKVLFHQLDEKMAKEEDLLSSGAENGKPRVLGDFKILKKIGSGGMASVFEAEQISLKRRVALKVLPAHLSFSDEAVKKFRREAEAGGRQCHPGIVSIYSVGEHDGMHYIAQELVKGGRSLHDQLEDLRKLDDQPIGYFREAALLVAEVAEALADAHESGVVHRDVKPSNILLTEDGRPMLTDFGLAKVQDALSLSRTGEFAGTPYYMSPEQAMSRRIGIDHRTDVYSLGVTLYEMLTLKRPFDGKTSHEVLKKIILIEPKNPSKVNPRVPRDLAVICLKAMEKDPARRYQSMAEFGSDLHRFLNAEVIRAKPSPLCTRVIKYIRRHPVCSVAVGVAFLGLIALVGSQLWAYAKIREKERTIREVENHTIITGLFPAFDLRSGRISSRTRTQPLKEKLRTAIESLDDGEIEPHVAALLHWRYGIISMELGHVGKSVELLREALSLFDSMDSVGEYNDFLLIVKNDLATGLTELGRYAEAEHFYREVLEVWQEELSENDPTTLSVMDSLAGAMGRRGKLVEAESLHRKVLEQYMLLLGEKNLDTQICMNNLAGVLADQYKFEEAEILFRKVFDARKVRLGEEHPWTLRSMTNLGAFLSRIMNYEEGEQLLRRALELQIKALGRDHPDTACTLDNLAGLLKRLKKFKEAKSLHEEALEIRTRVLGELHTLTLQSKFNLAALFMDQRMLSEAQQLLGEVQETLLQNERRNGFDKRDYPDWHLWKEGIGELYVITRRFDEARTICREVLDWRLQAYGKEHKYTVKALARLASTFMGMEQFDDAAKLLGEAFDVAEKILPVLDHDRLGISSMLGVLYMMQNRYEEAERHLGIYFDGLNALYGLSDPHAIDVLNSLIDLNKKTANKEKEARYRTLLEKALKPAGDE